MALRTLPVCLVLGLLLVVQPHVQADDSDSVDLTDVVVATNLTWADTVGKAKYALVKSVRDLYMFLGSGGRYVTPGMVAELKRLKPHFAQAATMLKKINPDVMLAMVDCIEDKFLTDKFKITAYPTLKWFTDGELSLDYTGNREAEEQVKWIRKKVGPAATPMATVEDLMSAVKNDKVYMLGLFDKLEGTEHDSFEAAASKSDLVAFYKTTNPAVAAALNLTAPGYALARQFDHLDLEVVHSSGHAAFGSNEELQDQLLEFARLEMLPPYFEFSMESQNFIFGCGINPQVIVAAPERKLRQYSTLTRALTSAAKPLRGKVIFVVAKQGTAAFENIKNFFGLEADKKDPQVAGFVYRSDKKYAWPKGAKVTATSLEAFARAVVDGTATPMLKSAPKPKEPTENGVTVVVGSTLDEIVNNPARDVLLEVYSPSCGHCKELAPTYEQLARRFEGVDSVVIAKMDGSQNMHPDVSATSYPTLLFFPAGEGSKPIPFTGERKLEEFVSFIKEHAILPFELPDEASVEDKVRQLIKGKQDDAADHDDDDDDDVEEADLEDLAAEAEGSSEDAETAEAHDEL